MIFSQMHFSTAHFSTAHLQQRIFQQRIFSRPRCATQGRGPVATTNFLTSGGGAPELIVSIYCVVKYGYFCVEYRVVVYCLDV